MVLRREALDCVFCLRRQKEWRRLLRTFPFSHRHGDTQHNKIRLHTDRKQNEVASAVLGIRWRGLWKRVAEPSFAHLVDVASSCQQFIYLFLGGGAFNAKSEIVFTQRKTPNGLMQENGGHFADRRPFFSSP